MTEKDMHATMALPDDAILSSTILLNQVRTRIDEHTGRTVRQLTNFPKGAALSYFRLFCQLPDGRMLAWGTHEHGNAILLEPDSGDIELLPYRFHPVKLRESDGRAWFLRSKNPDAPKAERKRRGRELWQVDLPSGDPIFIADIPDDLPGVIEDITIDGGHLILNEMEQDLTATPIPTTLDLESINRYLTRPRRGRLHVYHLASGSHRTIIETEGYCAFHVDTSPRDPGLLRYAIDKPDAQAQRVWTIRIDGSENHPIRPQAFGEMITHEFWWADPSYIGFTYQDRRQDPTLLTHHWAEYAQAKTRLGIADLAGREVFLSDPLNSYHTHLYRSLDGTLVSGEGTDGNSFVYAARFSMASTRIDLVRLATVHTPYVPFRGQQVDCNFSADGRWLIYGDQPEPEGPHQLFAVAVDL